MERAVREVPQDQLAIFTNTTKSIYFTIAPPGVEGNGSDPGLVALASCDNFLLRKCPNGHQVILTTRLIKRINKAHKCIPPPALDLPKDSAHQGSMRCIETGHSTHQIYRST